MREITYYRCSAAFPIVLPLLAYLLFWDSGPQRGVLDRMATLVVLSGVAAAPVYVPFVSALLWWLRRNPVGSYRFASFIAPILFVPVFVLYLLVLGYFTKSTEPLAGSVLFSLPYLLGVGFGYVVLVHLLRIVFSFCGWINDGQRTAV